jgi:hypothetical protein
VVPTAGVHQHDLAGREDLTAPTDARARTAAAAADRPSRFDRARDDVMHCGGVLRGAERELFCVGLSTLWEEFESPKDDEEPGTTEVDGFDRLTGPERLALLAQVAKGLHDRGEPCADLTAFNEAAVAAVIAQVRNLVSVEIDAQRSGFAPFSRNRRATKGAGSRRHTSSRASPEGGPPQGEQHRLFKVVRSDRNHALQDSRRQRLSCRRHLLRHGAVPKSVNEGLAGDSRGLLLSGAVLSDFARARSDPSRPSTNLQSPQGVAYTTVIDGQRRRGLSLPHTADALGPEPAVCSGHLQGRKRGVSQKALVFGSNRRLSHGIYMVAKGRSHGQCWREFGGKETR